MGTAVAEYERSGTRGDDHWAYVLRAWNEVDMPDGWRAEIREEGIVLVPPPSGAHGSIAHQIQRQLYRMIPEDWEIHQTSGVMVAELEKLFVPDLTVFPRAVLPRRTGEPVPADEVLLAVEIASKSNAKDDRGPKREAYAQGGVPLYLLVDGYDKRGRSVTLFANPRGGDYADVRRVAFGESIILHDPFGLKLETKGFQVPEE